MSTCTSCGGTIEDGYCNVCGSPASAPVTSSAGAAPSGGGTLRAYDARNGAVVWDFDTDQEFATTNGLKAHGGSLNGAGPAVVSGMVYVNSGYTNAMAGNVLLAFSAESR